jgi:hypothetical protein
MSTGEDTELEMSEKIEMDSSQARLLCGAGDKWMKV